ncbi:unnamed protein product [Urochloa decumbens]|uniref:transketolase n=1 Tax=Urochloa decumbens TaxID=240449 RepID=A0ABC9E5B0_9POAL
MSFLSMSTHHTMAVCSITSVHITSGTRSFSVPRGGAPTPMPMGHAEFPRFMSLASCSIHSSHVASLSCKHIIRAASIDAPAEEAATGQLLEKSVNTIRFLAIDAVEKANSGHVGMPMGCAPMGHILYDEVMRYNPKNPYWFNRDRFVLSSGHGCMLQYALLHLAGYDSVSVRPFAFCVYHLRYVILGDGCQMEGISYEACSLAGHWGLGKLVAFYDDNHISVDGDIDIAFTEDVIARFEALGWHTVWVRNGNTGYDDIREAIKEAKAVTDKPTLIKVTTTIGFGSPNKANSNNIHGSALGINEVEATRQNLGWSYEPFFVPKDVKSHWRRHVPRGAALEVDWHAKFAEYEKKYPEDAATLKSIMSGKLPAGWADVLPKYTPESPEVATRNLSQQCLNAVAEVLPGFLGDGNETAGAYKVAVLNRERPSVLALSRQKLPHLPGTSIQGVEKGGYIISDNSTRNKPDLIVLSTGSELQIAVKAADELRKEGKTVRVVSLVCWELFEEQSDEYKENVLPESVTARVSIEAGCTLGWQKYVGAKGKIIGINRFGASAPCGKIFEEYGITVDSVITAARSL